MSPVVRTIIIISAVFVFLIVVLIVITSLYRKHRITIMNNDITNIFNEYIKNNPTYTLTVSGKLEYDYVFETEKYIYYIKVVPNFSNQEITVNNSVKWQLRKSFNDETMRFVSGIEPLMRMDLTNTKGKTNKKLYIVYPNARSLLKYINECEMEFVHSDTDVYGTNIITYVNLNENRDIIKL